MKKIILVLTAVSLLGISSCDEKSFSRYPSVTIPEFANEDYYIQLSDKNPEVVYNAVVNLGEQAAGFGKILSDEKANKNSPEYIAADKTYHKIVELLNSPDSSVVAASLRFLQLFSGNYSKKPELLEPVLKIKSDNPQIIYEQIVVLERIVDKNTRIADSVLRKFLDNPSWVVSHSSFSLIDKLENENLRQELITRYKITSGEREKLLILTAVQNQPDDSIVDFFFSEILTAKNNKIRYVIYDILGNCKNDEKVLAWFTQNYGKIIPDDRKYLFEHCAVTMDEYFSSRLLAVFLSNGFIPDLSFLKMLDKKLEEYVDSGGLKPEDEKSLKNLQIVEKALIDGKVMAIHWQTLRKEKEVLNVKITALEAECNAVMREASMRIDKIFKKYNVPEDKRKAYLENSVISRETLKILFEPDKESKGQK